MSSGGDNLALHLTAFPNVFEEKRLPIPLTPNKGVVLKVEFTGVCHSDVHLAKDGFGICDFPLPIIPGHEISGRVHSLGKDAVTDLQVGDHVAVWPWGGCRNCHYCQRNQGICAKGAGLSAEPHKEHEYGILLDGGYQNYCAIDYSELLVPVPPGLGMDVAAVVTCGGITAYNAVGKLEESLKEALDVKGQARVGIIGSGGLGIWAIQFLKALYPSASVVAIDVSKDKIDDAVAYGADTGHCWKKEDTTDDAVQKLVATSGGYFDGVIDFTGYESSIERGLSALDQSGTLTLVGLAGQHIPKLPLLLAISREVKVKGTYAGSRKHVQDVFALIQEGKVRPPPMSRIRLSDVPQTISNLAAGRQQGRAVVQM